MTQPDGPRQWRVTLGYREDGQERELVLAVLATVRSELLLEPAALVLNTETACRHNSTLTERRPLPLTIAALQTTRPELVVALEPGNAEPGRDLDADHPGRSGRGFPSRQARGDDPLFSNDAEFRELKIPVTVIKRSRQRVQAAPAEVTLSGRADQPLPSRVVLLSGLNDEEVVVAGIKADDPAIRCQWAQGPGTQATLKISMDPSRQRSGSLHGAVHIQTEQAGRGKGDDSGEVSAGLMFVGVRRLPPHSHEQGVT